MSPLNPQHSKVVEDTFNCQLKSFPFQTMKLKYLVELGCMRASSLINSYQCAQNFIFAFLLLLQFIS